MSVFRRTFFHFIPTEGAHGLQRHGQRVGSDLLFPLLARIGQFVLAFLGWKKQGCPCGGQFLARRRASDDHLALFFVHIIFLLCFDGQRRQRRTAQFPQQPGVGKTKALNLGHDQMI